MLDYFGQALRIGDSVAIMQNGYRDFVTGKVAAFTPKKVRVEVSQRICWNGSTLRFPGEVIRHPRHAKD